MRKTGSRRLRRPGVAATAAALLGATPAVAVVRLHSIDVPAALGRALAAARRGPVPVLLPGHLVANVRRAYGAGGATRRGYSLSLGASPDCGDATACFLAQFSGTRGGRLQGGRRVALRGRAGRFYDLSCGASCAPASVAWVQHGVLYDIQANVATSHVRRALIALADSAIAAGAR